MYCSRSVDSRGLLFRISNLWYPYKAPKVLCKNLNLDSEYAENTIKYYTDFLEVSIENSTKVILELAHGERRP